MTSTQIALRASSVPRFMQCAGSQFLPHVQSTGSAARLGTVAHIAAAEIVTEQEPDIAFLARLHDVDESELWSLRYAADTVWSECGGYFPEPKTEVTLPALNLQGESASAALSGTADIVSVPGDGTLRIADWKSGWREGMHAGQLKTYALLAMRAHDAESEAENIDRVYASIFWMRNREIDGEWYSRELLEAWEQLLIEQLDKGAAGELVPGEGCTYCPVPDCPALRQQIALFQSPDADFQITSENVLQLHHLRAAIERRCGEVAKAVSHFVETSGPFATGDGRELAMVEMNKTSIVSSRAWPLLVEKFGADRVLELATFSKSAVEDAIKASAENGMKGKDVVAFFDELEKAQALDRSTSRFPRLIKQAE